jgi:acyl carrier protein
LQAYVLILELEETFEVDFDEAAIAGNDVSTIEDLCKLVRKIRNG